MRDVRAPEPVDRLLRVADDEQAAVRHVYLVPIGGVGLRAAGDPGGQLDLDRIGVLELVEQQPAIPPLQRRAHSRAVDRVAKQVAGEHEKVVELQPPLLAAGLRGRERRLPDPPGEPAQSHVEYAGPQLRDALHELGGTPP